MIKGKPSRPLILVIVIVLYFVRSVAAVSLLYYFNMTWCYVVGINVLLAIIFFHHVWRGNPIVREILVFYCALVSLTYLITLATADMTEWFVQEYIALINMVYFPCAMIAFILMRKHPFFTRENQLSEQG